MIRIVALIAAPGFVTSIATIAIGWILTDTPADARRDRRAARDCATRRRNGRREHP